MLTISDITGSDKQYLSNMCLLSSHSLQAASYVGEQVAEKYRFDDHKPFVKGLSENTMLGFVTHRIMNIINEIMQSTPVNQLFRTNTQNSGLYMMLTTVRDLTIAGYEEVAGCSREHDLWFSIRKLASVYSIIGIGIARLQFGFDSVEYFNETNKRFIDAARFLENEIIEFKERINNALKLLQEQESATAVEQLVSDATSVNDGSTTTTGVSRSFTIDSVDRQTESSFGAGFVVNKDTYSSDTGSATNETETGCSGEEDLRDEFDRGVIGTHHEDGNTSEIGKTANGAPVEKEQDKRTELIITYIKEHPHCTIKDVWNHINSSKLNYAYDLTCSYPNVLQLTHKLINDGIIENTTTSRKASLIIKGN